MANESIELYKPWEPAAAKDKIFFVSRKLDGVPVRIRNMGGHVVAISRQNEIITSIPHIVSYVGRMLSEGGSLIGELYIEGMPFKDISGLVRTKVPNTETGKLRLHVFDFDITKCPELPYARRWLDAKMSLRLLEETLKIEWPTLPVRIIPHIVANGPAAVEAAHKAIMDADPKAEGVVAHWVGKPFQPGTRRWDTMKLKNKDTLDVEVVGYDEAVDKFGRPKDMVGGINIKLWQWKGDKLTSSITNVGPGKMTLKERKIEWAKFKQGKFEPRIAEVHSMPDDTYEGLREGRWQRWRDDKKESDVRQRKVA